MVKMLNAGTYQLLCLLSLQTAIMMLNQKAEAMDWKGSKDGWTTCQTKEDACYRNWRTNEDYSGAS